jgi:cytochrome c-type biogenesis protein
VVVAVLALFKAFDSVHPLTFVVAFLGGIVSFLSPCVLPLVPGYLSIVTGIDLPTLEERGHGQYGRIVLSTSLFIAGFAAVWVPLGAGASALGSLFHRHQVALTRVSGVLVLLFAAFLVGSLFLRAPWLYQELRFHPRLGALGHAAPVVIGAAFAFGWTPCIGPVLGSIQTIAVDDGRPAVGAALLLVYTLGVGVPFLVCGLAFGALGGALRRVRRYFNWIVLGSALVMGVFGFLLVTNQMTTLTSHLQRFLQDHGMSWLVNLG